MKENFIYIHIFNKKNNIYILYIFFFFLIVFFFWLIFFFFLNTVCAALKQPFFAFTKCNVMLYHYKRRLQSQNFYCLLLEVKLYYIVCVFLQF